MKEGWEIKQLGELCDTFTDGNWIESKDQSTEGIRLIQTGNIGLGKFVDKQDKARYISKDTFDRLKCTEVFPGDILISRLPDPVGKACQIPVSIKDKLITGVDCTIVRLLPETDSSYLLYFAMSNLYLDQVNKLVSGTTRDRISRKNLGTIQIPLPPLPEQQRIISIIDKAFEAIDKAIENTQKNLQNAKELFESYLNNVFEKGGEGWECKKLKDITLKIGSGATPKGGQENYKTSGISLIRSMNVYDLQFKPEKLAFIDDEQAKSLSNVTLKEDDVLLNITGASIARCCVVPNNYLPARVNQHVSIIRPNSSFINSIFLNLLLAARFYKNQLLFTGEQGSTRQALTKVQLETFEIRFPNPKEQLKIIAEICSINDETNLLQTNYQQKLHDLEELKKSVLNKAFAGEL